MSIVRSKDLALTPEQAESRRRRADVIRAREIRTELEGKRFADMKAADRNELLRAVALHLGFITEE